MKELKLEELTTRQKLGMAMMGHILGGNVPGNTEYALEMIRNHALGGIWINPTLPKREEIIAAIKEAADYPILIMCDAEEGIVGRYIGNQNALGATGKEEYAYIFGKVTAVTARQLGYNVVCNPILDMGGRNAVCNDAMRSMGNDKYKVASLAMAMARGMHDGGVMTVGKHYPSSASTGIDSHMAEAVGTETVEELLEYNLYPYLQMMKEDLLDGIMTAHKRMPAIDPDYPTSLSQKVIGVIREQGFDGFAITDALSMMGVVAKFGRRTSKGLAIANGNDLALTWHPNKESYEAICETYDQGLIPDERLDEAVRRVLEAQHKTLKAPKYTELTEEDLEQFDRINRDSIYARTDDGVEVALAREGRHYFTVLVQSGTQVSDSGKVDVDQTLRGWYRPGEIMMKLEKLFPNSTVSAINEFPSPWENQRVLDDSVDYDDVVFITFMDGRAYLGRECLTSRIVSLIQAMQVTNRISTIVHFGNPFVLEELEHVSRVLIGSPSTDCIDYTLDVLAGECPAKGTLTYDVHLK